MNQCELSSRQKHVAKARAKTKARAKRGKTHVTKSWLVETQTGGDVEGHANVRQMSWKIQAEWDR